MKTASDLICGDPRRHLAHHWLDLPFHEQVVIAEHFGVDWRKFPAVDRNQEFDTAVFRTITATKRTAEFWKMVEAKHPEGVRTFNPYESLTPS